MDPAAMSAVLLAVVGGAGGTLGGQLWSGLVSLVRRPSQQRPSQQRSGDASVATSGGTAGEASEETPGEAELLALQAAPADRDRATTLARALAEALLARAGDDPDFRQALAGWWARTAPIRVDAGQVTNTISGGTQHGPVLQGRDFGNITFGAPSGDTHT